MATQFRMMLVLSLALGAVSRGSPDFTLASVEGMWDNVTGGEPTVKFFYDVVVPYGNGLQDQVRWGTPLVADGPKSGLGFTGSAPLPVTFPVGNAFQVGQ